MVKNVSMQKCFLGSKWFFVALCSYIYPHCTARRVASDDAGRLGPCMLALGVGSLNICWWHLHFNLCKQPNLWKDG